MAREILTAREVQVASVRVHSDGGGLNLKVTDRGSSWAFRFTAPDGRHREMGFGPATRGTLAQAGKSLTNARAKADWARALLARGIDPMDHQQAERDAVKAKIEAKKAAEKSERLTLCRVARAYHEKSVEPRRTDKHAAQWIASLEQGVPPAIWNKPIADVTAYELLDAIAALQLRVPETASRVRQRLEVIFDDAEFHGLCTSNPAKIIKRKLAERPKGRESGHFAALPYAEIPAFVKALRDQPGVSARALEFALLTAARTGEVLGAVWGEIDAQAGIWRVPGARMKGGEDHVVYLPARALQIVESMRELQGDPFVFPSPTSEEKPLSNMSMLAVLRRMSLADVTTVHGLCRASFSTWAYENGVARAEVIEATLAHSEQDRVKAAYNRASFNAERATLLRAWADFCDGKKVEAVKPPSAEVIPMSRAA